MAVVVSHMADDFDRLAAAALRQIELCDLVELRLDRVGHPGEERLRRFIQECSKPVIVTVHGGEAFGSFRGSVDERCELLLAASRAGASFVDIDWTLSLELGEVEGKCHRIVSRHELDGTPLDLAEFDREVRDVLYEGDVVKLVTHARTTEDGLRMLRYLREARPGLVAFCSGPQGAFTRVLAPIFGSPFTYAAPADLPGMEAGVPTAPGQLRVNDLLAIVPPGGLTPETAVLGVVGNPIGHSISPFVHGMALKNAHLDAVYVAFEPQSFEEFIRLADDANFRGLAVTAPFKRAAFEIAKVADAPSQQVKACNTLIRDGDGWRGANTDVPAIRETLETIFPVHAHEPGRPVALAAAEVLILGAGGAAAAAVGALLACDVRPTLAARDAAKAEQLAAQLGVQAIAWPAIEQHPYDVLIHCTPVGAGGNPHDPAALPIPSEWIRPGTLVLDAVYRPIGTALLRAARAKNCTAVPGGEWFVRQATAQFELVTHQSADEALMRAAVEGALTGANRGA